MSMIDNTIKQALLLAQEELEFDKQYGLCSDGQKREVDEALNAVTRALKLVPEDEYQKLAETLQARIAVLEKQNKELRNDINMSIHNTQLTMGINAKLRKINEDLLAALKALVYVFREREESQHYQTQILLADEAIAKAQS